jgi:hypothetical protein
VPVFGWGLVGFAPSAIHQEDAIQFVMEVWQGYGRGAGATSIHAEVIRRSVWPQALFLLLEAEECWVPLGQHLCKVDLYPKHMDAGSMGACFIECGGGGVVHCPPPV